MKNYAENRHQKLVRNSLLILVNNSKQLLHARNSLKEDFERALLKNLKQLYFLFQTQPLLKNKDMKNKMDPKFVNSRCSGYETNSEKFLY